MKIDKRVSNLDGSMVTVFHYEEARDIDSIIDKLTNLGIKADKSNTLWGTVINIDNDRVTKGGYIVVGRSGAVIAHTIHDLNNITKPS